MVTSIKTSGLELAQFQSLPPDYSFAVSSGNLLRSVLAATPEEAAWKAILTIQTIFPNEAIELDSTMRVIDEFGAMEPWEVLTEQLLAQEGMADQFERQGENWHSINREGLSGDEEREDED